MAIVSTLAARTSNELSESISANGFIPLMLGGDLFYRPGKAGISPSPVRQTQASISGRDAMSSSSLA